VVNHYLSVARRRLPTAANRPLTGTLPAMPRALVLNASLEPLSVVPTRRAIVLVFRERADVLETNGALWRSEAVAMQSPSVVKLRHYVRVPFARRVPLNRRAVFIRDENRCQYCERRAENLDHVIPKSQGGGHRWDNVVACCRRCNTRKGGHTPSQAGLSLIRSPRPPRRDTWVAVALGAAPDPEWEPYLVG
jgi:5-methylcytosine-specific restriction endonuclease McrA